MKHDDPDAWRAELNKLEQATYAAGQEKSKQTRESVTRDVEIGRRAKLLADHNQQHPDAQITDDVLERDLPPRLVNKLNDGSISFDDFLIEASKYIATPKTIKSGEADNLPNLGKVGSGQDTPQGDSNTDYANAIF